MSSIDVKVPDIGDFKDVPVIEVFVKPGDVVAAEDSLVTLESDKATMDVPAPAAGKVEKVLVKVGDKVSEGSPIVVLDSTAAVAAKAAPAPAAAPSASSAPAKPAPPATPPRRYPAQRLTPAKRTSSARCSCWAPGRAATAPHSAPPI